MHHTTKTYFSKHLERFPMKLHQEFLPANRQSDMKQPTLCEQKYSSDEALIKSWEEYFLLCFVIFIGFCTSVSNDDLKILWLLP